MNTAAVAVAAAGAAFFLLVWVARLRAQNADLQDAVLGLEALAEHLRSGEPTRSLEEVMAELQRHTPSGSQS